jgi:hypothetical protein
MKMKDYQLTQQEYQEYCAEFEDWCDQQEARWGFTREQCLIDQEARHNQYVLPHVFHTRTIDETS